MEVYAGTKVIGLFTSNICISRASCESGGELFCSCGPQNFRKLGDVPPYVCLLQNETWLCRKIIQLFVVQT